MTDAFTPAEEEDALAAEYVLGVLDAPKRAAVERRIRSDAGRALSRNGNTGWAG